MLLAVRNVPAFASDSARAKIWLLTGPTLLTRLALSGIARAAISGQTVWVLDGANSFDAYFVARLARRHGQHAPQTILSRIRLSRAFTCYQAAHVIQWRLSDIGAAPPAVIFCLGLLETFYDEDVPFNESVLLLKAVLENISRLAEQGHRVVITARELGTGNGARTFLFKRVKEQAGHIARIEPLFPVVDRQYVQARLLDR